MKNSKDLSHCDVRLKHVFEQGAAKYAAAFPNGPTLSVAETRRNKTTQTERFRQKLGNAQFGQSPQNHEESRGLKWKLTAADGSEVTEKAAHEAVWLFIEQAGIEQRIPLRWGGQWGNWNHLEMLRWRQM